MENASLASSFTVTDGKYQAIVQDSIHFSPDSRRFAYAAKRYGKGIVVIDGKEFPAGLACLAGFPVFSANNVHFLYVAAQSGGKVSVTMDGKEGDALEAARLSSPDGKRFVYVAKDGMVGHVILDAIVGPEYENISSPIFNSDG